MLGAYLEAVRRRSPLVLSITNFVTVNDCANIVLAAGASPVMCEIPEAAADFAAAADVAAVNLGTQQPLSLESARVAAEVVRERGLPAVLDPVGAGASKTYTASARDLLVTGAFSCIRGNISEIRALAGQASLTRGVDAGSADAVTESNLPEMISFIRAYAAASGAIIAASGAIDLVSDAERTFVIRNGHPMMPRITGSGCMLTVLTAAFLAASPEHPLEAAAAASCAMGLAGEIAHASLGPGEGTGTFRTRLLDAMSLMTGAALDGGAKYEIR